MQNTSSSHDLTDSRAASAHYAASDHKRIDDELDELDTITFTSCGEDIVQYHARQTASLQKLASMDLSPEQWKDAHYRHGLPKHLRAAVSYQSQELGSKIASNGLGAHEEHRFFDDLRWAHRLSQQHLNQSSQQNLEENPSLVKGLQLDQSIVDADEQALRTSRDVAIAKSTVASGRRGDDSTSSSYSPTEFEDDPSAASNGDPVLEDDQTVAGDVEPAAQPPTVTMQPPETDKRRRKEDDTTSTLEEQSDTVAASQGEDTTGTETEATRVPESRRTAKKATAGQRNPRPSIKRLAQPVNANSVSVKTDVSSDAKGSNLYFLGPHMLAYFVYSQLLLFATNLPKPGPLAMNVATLPKQALMTKILSDTIRNYARSRTSHNLTNAALGSPSDESVLEPVDLDQDLFKEPTDITQAKNLQESMTRVSSLWKQKQTLGVRQKMLESWAIAIIFNAVGQPIGETPNRTMQGRIKRAAQDLMPVLKPAHMQDISNQTMIRTQYYWKLLAEFRTLGLPFIVAYRTSTVDTALLIDGANRLRGEDIHPWIPTIKALESHVTDWFDALEGGKGRSDLKQLRKSMTTPSWWWSPWEQGLWNSFRQTPGEPKLTFPATTLGFHKYGYNGWMSKRKSWSVMEVVGTGQSIAIADIPEASFLGVVPGLLRCSVSFEEGCIPGPDGIWLDTRNSKGSLAKIALGAKEDVNTVLAWQIAGDSRAPRFETAFLLAFSCRPVEMFSELVRWDEGVPQLVQVKEEEEVMEAT